MPARRCRLSTATAARSARRRCSSRCSARPATPSPKPPGRSSCRTGWAPHTRCFAFLGGVPEIVVPDNLRSAVSKAHRYEPDINPSYRDLAEHYGVAVVPARARKPRDKAKAEVGCAGGRALDPRSPAQPPVLLLGRTQHGHQPCCWSGSIKSPSRSCPAHAARPSRAIDQPALQPLPEQPYVYAEWKKVRVHIDYHVEVDGPLLLGAVPTGEAPAGGAADGASTVECFHANQRVASHLRSLHKGRHTTQTEHMPKSHREHAEWTPQRLIRWAEQTGPNTAGVIRLHPRTAHPSAARLPGLPGHPAPGQDPRRSAAGAACQPSRHRPGRVQLQKPRIDPAPRAGKAAAGPAEPAPAAGRPRQPARPRLLPLN